MHFIAPGLVCVAAMNGASFEVTYNIYVRLVFEKDLRCHADDADQAGRCAGRRNFVGGNALLCVRRLFLRCADAFRAHAFAIVTVGDFCDSDDRIAFSPRSAWFSRSRIPNIDMFSFYFTLFLTPLFLFSDVFFPLKERLAGAWLWVAEALPLLHPVRLARASFRGEFSAIIFWDLAYTLGMSLLLLLWARRSVRDRLTN